MDGAEIDYPNYDYLKVRLILESSAGQQNVHVRDFLPIPEYQGRQPFLNDKLIHSSVVNFIFLGALKKVQLRRSLCFKASIIAWSLMPSSMLGSSSPRAKGPLILAPIESAFPSKHHRFLARQKDILLNMSPSTIERHGDSSVVRRRIISAWCLTMVWIASSQNRIKSSVNRGA